MHFVQMLSVSWVFQQVNGYANLNNTVDSSERRAFNGLLFQLGEYIPCKDEVEGSNPLQSTISEL